MFLGFTMFPWTEGHEKADRLLSAINQNGRVQFEFQATLETNFVRI